MPNPKFLFKFLTKCLFLWRGFKLQIVVFLLIFVPYFFKLFLTEVLHSFYPVFLDFIMNLVHIDVSTFKYLFFILILSDIPGAIDWKLIILGTQFQISNPSTQKLCLFLVYFGLAWWFLFFCGLSHLFILFILQLKVGFIVYFSFDSFFCWFLPFLDLRFDQWLLWFFLV